MLHSAYQYQLVINLNCFSIFYRGQKSPRYTEQHNWCFGGGRGGVNSGFVTYSLPPPRLLLSLVVFEAATVGTMISMMMIFPDKIMNMMLHYKIRLMMLINLTRYKPLTLIKCICKPEYGPIPFVYATGSDVDNRNTCCK